jgi:predicted membrane GTPase involved in stress response
MTEREEIETWLDGIQRGSLGDLLEIQRLIALARKGLAATDVADAADTLHAIYDKLSNHLEDDNPTENYDATLAKMEPARAVLDAALAKWRQRTVAA